MTITEDAGTGTNPRPDQRTRARLARIFGDVLPDTTRDERGDGSESTRESSDEWLRRQVPPHHG